MNITYTKKPSSSDIDYITSQINQETRDYGEASPFAFYIRDDQSLILAGANGFIVYGAIYTDQLWVDTTYRRQGLAKKIMEEIHDYGRAEGCKLATVQTMSFQGAETFYKKLGYVQDFRRMGYTASSSCIFMKKCL